MAAGSKQAVIDALTRGADLRVYTEFLFEEHIEPGGRPGEPEQDGLIREVIDFRETIVIEGRHAAGITTLRQALHPPFGFNGGPKMSFFLYTVDGEQACANVVFGDPDPAAAFGTRLVMPSPADMPKMSPDEVFDLGTLAPSRNFVYDFERYRYFVRDDWRELDSFEAIEAAQIAGREIKVGVAGLLGPGSTHEVFVAVGSGFLHTGPRLYACLTHPLVRVAPAIPLRYASGNWDVAWVFLRTDGLAVIRRFDPQTRAWTDREERFEMRWFAR
ncbi:MAG: hypothetical protein FJ038_08880 [Chloroflexi bacterium]|nr:hypothetical protein [Chloroflexota bacterium]